MDILVGALGGLVTVGTALGIAWAVLRFTTAPERPPVPQIPLPESPAESSSLLVELAARVAALEAGFAGVLKESRENVERADKQFRRARRAETNTGAAEESEEIVEESQENLDLFEGDGEGSGGRELRYVPDPVDPAAEEPEYIQAQRAWAASFLRGHEG